MEELRQRAVKIADLYTTLNDAFPDGIKREHMILATMAGIADAQNALAISIRKGREKP